VRSLMLREIDALRRHAHGAERRLGGGGGRCDEREHRAVMRCVGLNVEQRHGRHRRQRGAQGVERRLVPALGKVGHALDERSGHGNVNAERGTWNAEHSDEPTSPFRSAFRLPRSAFS